jgi:hypothetical protein
MKPNFLKLNIEWSAEPNAPDPHIDIAGDDIILSFYVNPFQFKEFEEDELGLLRFVNCTRYLGPTNDEGWYRGQCRFSHIAPEWGEFYQVVGDANSTEGPTDWSTMSSRNKGERRHFLFYFRDHTFECLAEGCIIEARPGNPLRRTGKSLPTSD